ncbi:MAG: RAMP superfamily protein [Gomphosphaeria aponina SAG 52.96 = DSM 107014]|uniref:RAMP superfamily protein n=1 Tax=Gomphosphaeria aponina SAG 52.96 = DSM 107014 TaxID=1521640 RepID=A0A941GVE8_9CHRO|nr:RAMP superfamily protein [Gomphosphaeria aponina SAG 52.96 = DSM 107014]
MTIPDAYKKVPLMYQAQTAGRSQLQYAAAAAENVERWVSEWIEKAYSNEEQWVNEPQTRTYTLNWRFVTNGGQDDGIIRPVIGAFGLPYYPGSSMKGAFLRFCTQSQGERYCGKKLEQGDSQPGILRFHGGYPTDNSWQENLVDLVHPQQEWQVKSNDTNQRARGETAFSLISLYEPEFKFSISSNIILDEEEWQTIWEIWQKAMVAGLGCRVSAGYGQTKLKSENIIYTAHLQGQGMASMLLDKTPEFRPNIFKAALRGHGLRIFGGLTSAENADSLIETLLGGVTGDGKVGLLAINWVNDEKPEYGIFNDGHPADTYKVKGELRFALTRQLPKNKQQALTKLIKTLTRFAMVLGGFGKSWRRADHRLFYPGYYTQNQRQSLIGCHWTWGKKSLQTKSDRHNVALKLNEVTAMIEKVISAAREWMELENIPPLDYQQSHQNRSYANWRESWHPAKVQVWVRIAENATDAQGLPWFHGMGNNIIYHSDLTGRMGQIGRLWHRMYPQVKFLKSNKDPNKLIHKETGKYLELLTFFPDNSPVSEDFQKFLDEVQPYFDILWESQPE